MLDTSHNTAPIVFLHIPKTAGQTVHNELARVVGQAAVSPVRVHTQARDAAAQFPDGFRLYSGHIDWSALDAMTGTRFVFSVLRDPAERIASFYFYLRKEAKKLDAPTLNLPQNAGKQAALMRSADDYFFGGDAAWQSFIQDHYDNFYCRYFGSRQVRAGAAFSALPDRRKLRMALRNIEQIDWVYSVDNLTALEQDLKSLYNFDLNLTGKRDNTGDLPVAEPRWPRLIQRLDSDATRHKLEQWIELDLALMERLEL